MKRKNLALLWSGALLYAVVLSACGAGADAPNVKSTQETHQEAVWNTERTVTTAVPSPSTSSLPEPSTSKQEPDPIQNTVSVESQTLGLSGISNARQLGGYVTQDGMRVKQNILLRTGKLSDGTQEDLDMLRDQYAVTEIIDFRTTSEIDQAPDPTIGDAIYRQIHILDENADDTGNNKAIVGIYSKMATDPAGAMLEMYRMGALSEDMYTSMFESQTALDGYRAFVDALLAHDESGALLWHCTGGKDRAGCAAMITLTLLGVDKETVLQDFALTNEFNREKIDYMVQGAAALTDDQTELDGVAALVGVSRPYMEKVYTLAEQESGTMLDFLKDKLHITDVEIQTLRAKYLEPIS